MTYICKINFIPNKKQVSFRSILNVFIYKQKLLMYRKLFLYSRKNKLSMIAPNLNQIIQ